ncbi:glycosyltransferase involved in cell wall biosynthesis [Neolewinella xylanilytica]|uniref:Glycosyltransferase involved in cell wall biosynthesis n=1 Tax=Neolewinella xylanilytica TaxID=1514080 RepID=A0A2S6I338_9BACT|nr:glycosyltransferase family 1 protein [Neolewinella xylanilytica]PPK85596.1 glycosyltransferase involved in cell wall biosynthesis [Neolewinella xylanilytica]
MRLGYDSKRLFRNFTGLGNYSRTTLWNLVAHYPDEAYHLYTPPFGENPVTTPFRTLANVDVHTAPFKSTASLWRSYGVVRELKRHRIELYHGLSHELPLGLQAAGIRSVVTVHDLIFRTHPQLYPLIDRTIYHLKTRYACRTADRVVAISEATKSQIVAEYGIPAEKIDVVYQSCDPLFFDDRTVDMARLRQRYTLPDRYLLFVGSITRRKNLEIVLEAYTQLDDRHRLPIIVVGRGSKHRAELERHRAFGTASPYLHWIDDLSDDLALKTLYRNATALIYPSLAEGFGLPVVEALLSRTPVITSDRSSLPEAGGPDSLYIDPTDAATVATAVARLLDDPDLAQQMREKGYHYALNRFGPTATASSMMGVYRKILAR